MEKRETVQSWGVVQKERKFAKNFVVEVKIPRPTELVDVGFDGFVRGSGDEQNKVPERGAKSGETASNLRQILDGDP